LKSQFDIIVVGGGPSGSTAARTASEKGANVLLVEENVCCKKSTRCTGLISLRAFEGSGAGWDCVLRKIRGAFIHTPGGRRLSLDGKDIKAVVIDRNRFDQELLRKAEQAGVKVRAGTKAVGLEGNKVKLQEDGLEEIVKAKVIIGADGPHSKIAKWSGLPSPQKLLPTIQAIVLHKPVREDFVEVYLGRDIAPNFFAWTVPAPDGLARVGLASDKKGSLRAHLNRLLENRLSNKIIEIGTGVIPLGPAAKTVTHHVMLVGDAAGQVKSTSGGGIYTGMLCARMAGEVAAKCVFDGDASAEALSEYERRWRSLLQKELFFGLQAHRLLSHLSDSDLNKIFTLLDSPKILKIFTKYGDIDYPSILARELFKAPRIWRKLLSVIPAKELLKGMLRLLV